MKITLDLETLLPGADWQRLETWAAMSGLTPEEYVHACIRRGHRALRDDVAGSDASLSPAGEDYGYP